MPHSEDDFIMNMKRLEYSSLEIARKLKVSEGTIRYRIKRKQAEKTAGSISHRVWIVFVRLLRGG